MTVKIMEKIFDYAIGLGVFFGLAACEDFTYWLDSTIDNSIIEVGIVALIGLSAVLLKTAICSGVSNYFRKTIKNIVKEAVFKD